MNKEQITQLLKTKQSTTLHSEINLVLEDQYKKAYDSMMDAYNAGLFVGLIGPVGAGKTALCRKFAQDLGLPFSWVTFSDLVRPSTLIGSLDPTLVFNTGFDIDSFIPGPFTLSCLEGGVFLANELNRGDEYVLNSLLDALEERKLFIPALRTWYDVDDRFYLIAAMNPSEMRGTRKLPSAIKDRIKVWIHLDYPKRATELRIVQQNVLEYNLPPDIIEHILEIVSHTRNDPQVETPASIRSSIGMARLVAQRAQRLNQSPDAHILAECVHLTLKEGIKLKPGRDINSYLSNLTKQIIGV